MKLQLISDLHTEFYPPDPKRFIESIEIVPDLDFLVMAGDMVVMMRQPENHIRMVFDHFASKARHVIYVIGNHEYYGGMPSNVESLFHSIQPANVHCLKNTRIEIEGQKFFGGTMWFGNADQLNFFYRQQMNDFYQIRGFEPWVYQQNAEFNANARDFVSADTIVVTHHMPHMQSTPVQYRGSALNRFFVCDQTQLIEERQPRLWLHGHTHHKCDYTVGNTRVIANPHGYPNEIPGPYPQVVIEL